MSTTTEHHYARPAPDRLLCACGHAEPIDDDFSGAIERMNAHIRGSYTDEQWEDRMGRTKLATLDATTGTLTLPPEGSKS